MSLKAKLEAIIYATEDPVTLSELALLLRGSVLAEMRTEEEARLALNEIVADHPALTDEVDEQQLLASGAADLEQSIEHFSEVKDTTHSIADVSATQTEIASGDATTSAAKDKQVEEKEQLKAVKARISSALDELISDYNSGDRGIEIRQLAGGYRMATKPEHHDVVVSFAKSLKPPVRLSLQALETLAVIAYKQPVTVPEISEIRGVDSAGVIATLLDRKLITTAGRKQVIGRPILYKTTKEFLMRFGLKDMSELPSVEEFEKLGEPQAELFATSPSDLAANPASESTNEQEPVTEAVPAPSHHLLGDTNIPADGAFATEAEPEPPQEKS